MSIYDDIKICCVDVDGVLTDGTYQVSIKGDFSKTFHTRDFDALSQLLKKGIIVVIISTSHDDVILKQIERIKRQSSMSHLWTEWEKDKKLIVVNKSGNKVDKITPILNASNLVWKNLAYIGDAEGDLEAMGLSRLSCCPSDATDKAKEVATYISSFPGGRGAVYDFCVDILKKRKK